VAPIAIPVSQTRFGDPGGGSPFEGDPFGPPKFGPGGPGPGPGGLCQITVNTPIGPVSKCLPGCACLGGSLNFPGVGSVCLGNCAPNGGGGNGLPFDPLGPQGPVPFPPKPTDPKIFPNGGGCKVTGTAQAKILCPPGCHANKADYFLKSGSFVAAGTRCVTNRRRNPLNPRALDRAAGRLRSAQKAVKFLQAAKIPKKRRR